MTLKELGKELGAPRERVRQIENEALEKLRQAATQTRLVWRGLHPNGDDGLANGNGFDGMHLPRATTRVFSRADDDPDTPISSSTVTASKHKVTPDTRMPRGSTELDDFTEAIYRLKQALDRQPTDSEIFSAAIQLGFRQEWQQNDSQEEWCYSSALTEYLAALSAYKQRANARFLAWSTILDLLHSLGYTLSREASERDEISADGMQESIIAKHEASVVGVPDQAGVLKSESKKAASKKAAPKATKKTASKKAAPKATKKTASKKATPKATKKTASKKATPKATSKKVASKKAVPKATTKKATSKKAVPKATTKKATSKRATPSRTTKRSAPQKVARASVARR